MGRGRQVPRQPESEGTVNNVMLDLETMGLGPNAAIIAIGAVMFDPETMQLGSEFYRIINLESAVAAGGIMDAGTVMWWLEQGAAARAELTSDKIGRASCRERVSR